MASMERIGNSFARYARRSLPFLARHHARIVPALVELVPTTNEPQATDSGPRFSVLLGGEDGTVRASVTLASEAVAIVIEGALGAADNCRSHRCRPSSRRRNARCLTPRRKIARARSRHRDPRRIEVGSRSVRPIRPCRRAAATA